MQDNEEKVAGFGHDEEEWIRAQRAREAKRNKKKRGGETGTLSMNSLMDILVIMLVFLLKSYGDEPIKAVGEDLKVPSSASQLNPEDTTAVTISRKSILVNDKLAVDVKNGAIDQSQKRGGDRGMIIQPLFDELTDAINKKKRETTLLGQTYEPVATIIADQTTPYRLITEVMYTAGQAELRQFKFAVIKGDMKSFGPAD
ncbi:MAG: biopolymer transporter ExbD [Bradymonadaceae bacterium]|nr:biopolymer transporter ExbD [Lujinxingiaceae bacterium]